MKSTKFKLIRSILTKTLNLGMRFCEGCVTTCRQQNI